MKKIDDIMTDKRIRLKNLTLTEHGVTYLNGLTGRLRIRDDNLIIFSIDGNKWEHVSLSFQDRCPTWDEMCIVKDIFWRKDETVVQFHPKESSYVNLYPFCLHLWKKVNEEWELPDNE